MTRKEKREIKEKINIFSDVTKIIKQYFPDLIPKLEKLRDRRNQSYVYYTMSTITVTRLLGLLCGIKSMRETTDKFNTEETIENIANLLEVELGEIPHYDTINNVFLHTICTYDKAITRKRFEIHKRIKNKHKRSKCNHNTINLIGHKQIQLRFSD